MMKTTVQWLDEVKLALGIESDYATAKYFGVTRATVSGWRTGRTTFDDDTAFVIADALGVNPLEVLVSTRAERAKTPEQRQEWEGRWENFSRSFRSLVLATEARQTSVFRV